MKQPVVSVITVCRNASTTIEACLNSLSQQSWRELEHIVVDGASTDGTLGVIARYRAGITSFVSEPDHGLYDAMNKGLALARGDFIIFLNADDTFASPHALRDAMRDIAQRPDADVYYGSLEVRGPLRTTIHVPPPPERAAEEMVLGCLPHQATLARPAVFERTGPFDLRWRRHADYDWWLKVIGDPFLRLQRIPTVVGSFAMGGASSDLAAGQPEVYAIQNASPVYRSAEWDRRRLDMFQQAYLKTRIALAAEAEGRSRITASGLKTWLVEHLPPSLLRPAVRVRHMLGTLTGRQR